MQKNTTFSIVDTIEVSGYTIDQYFTQQDFVCLGANCIYTDVVGVTVVESDQYLYDQNGAYGILGLGPNSPLWRAFIDTETKQASYSVSLAAPTVNGASNVTLGASLPSDYEGKTSLTSVGDENSVYLLDLFAFGTVYQTDGVDTSDYFVNYTSEASTVQFNTNQQSLLLTDSQLYWFTTYLQNLTSYTNVNRGLLLDCSCQNETLTNMMFKLSFSNNLTGYMRVPLTTFAEDSNGKCLLNVLGGNSKMVLGAMFFEQFFAFFTNQYSQDLSTIDSTQVQLFVG